jgi:hypothetical protein
VTPPDTAPPRRPSAIRDAMSAPDPRVLVTLPSGKRVWMLPRRNVRTSVAAAIDPTRRTVAQIAKDETP